MCSACAWMGFESVFRSIVQMKYRDISQILQGIQFPGTKCVAVESIFCAHDFARVVISQKEKHFLTREIKGGG